MNELLSEVIKAHGGLDRWSQFDKLSATIIGGGAFWGLKSLTRDEDQRQIVVWFREQRSTLIPFGDPDWYCDFTPGRVAIVSNDGAIVADRAQPRASFAGHDRLTPWDPLHLGYFEGYALWTCLSTPFLLAMRGVEVVEIEPATGQNGTWRGLRALFPGSIATHCAIQEFFFGDDRLLRRHDYRIDIAGGFEIAELASDYIDVSGIRLPSKRRAYLRGPDQRPNLVQLMASIDISDVELF